MFRRSTLAIAGACVAAALPAAGAQAAQVLCVPGSANAPTLSPNATGGCNAGYRPTTVVTNSDYVALTQRLDRLERLLAGVTRTTNVGGQDTLTLSGMNLQVTNGAGATSSSNGRGNLVVGYNENGSVTGSHNVVAGTGNAATSFGSVVGGVANRASGAYSAAFGWRNTASGTYASVAGGTNNIAASGAAGVAGGCGNVAGSSTAPTVSTAVTDECRFGQLLYAPWVGGGLLGRSTGVGTVVSGGDRGSASGIASVVSGGVMGRSTNTWSVVAGGVNNGALGVASFAGGGLAVTAEADRTAALGGFGKTLRTGGELWPPAPATP